ncbi:FK506-binding protein 7 [Fistulifera solaris]|uniref:peptidylprolyl isomerase n=1 Tax=Fistulifera solaris TaxID=1519565 RepID=A0A1Z5KS47_FISSO|nr:FK506-binding protein 7 [Fistulifera solaris]|eukprot:GAX29109.1 FK506-binding protein 7 [Fistulifera solaris]
MKIILRAITALVLISSTLGFPCRRHVLRNLLLTVGIPPAAVAFEKDVTLVMERPGETLGLELINTRIGSRSVVAIQRIMKPNPSLLPGMILNDYESAAQVQERLRTGPYPVTLKFTNLAAGGDAISDLGTPLVTAQDALRLAQQTATDTITSAYEKTILQKTTKCSLQSRRGDVLEIKYEARFQSPQGPIYDSSERRGTGRPYQMVLGSGDILAGVDLGLYDMCPGEIRTLQIPPPLGYGPKGNKMFRVPPDTTLFWKVQLMTINGMGVGDNRNREEMEQRVSY